MTLKAFDSMGQEVKSGDCILSFRGEKAVFVCCTRERTNGKSGKVVVTWVGEKYQLEYYDKVFDLCVKNVQE